jgi:hypothetical protein
MRTPKTIAWVKSLLKPLQFIYSEFRSYRSFTNKKLSYNYQVMYLEKGLNDYFNGGQPSYNEGVPTGIYIDHVNDEFEDVPVYWKSENKPPFVLYWKSEEEEATPMYWQSEYNNQIDYIIYVPIILGDVDAPGTAILISKIKAFMESYKLPGYKYRILNYTP